MGNISKLLWRIPGGSRWGNERFHHHPQFKNLCTYITTSSSGWRLLVSVSLIARAAVVVQWNKLCVVVSMIHRTRNLPGIPLLMDPHPKVSGFQTQSRSRFPPNLYKTTVFLFSNFPVTGTKCKLPVLWRVNSTLSAARQERRFWKPRYERPQYRTAINSSPLCWAFIILFKPGCISSKYYICFIIFLLCLSHDCFGPIMTADTRIDTYMQLTVHPRFFFLKQLNMNGFLRTSLSVKI